MSEGFYAGLGRMTVIVVVLSLGGLLIWFIGRVLAAAKHTQFERAYKDQVRHSRHLEEQLKNLEIENAALREKVGYR